MFLSHTYIFIYSFTLSLRHARGDSALQPKAGLNSLYIKSQFDCRSELMCMYVACLMHRRKSAVLLLSRRSVWLI